jgi:hypothetical protein
MNAAGSASSKPIGARPKEDAMRKKQWIAAAASCAAVSAVSYAVVAGLSWTAMAQQSPQQQQLVTPPKQVYWMGETTNSGLGGMLGANPMDMSAGGAANATMQLQ